MPTPAKPKATVKAASRPALPAVTVARFQEALTLLDRLVDEQADLFIDKGQQYRQRHRAGTERKLNADEAAQVAAAMASAVGAEALPPVVLAEAVQASDLRAYDEPQPVELLLAAGVATAPAAMQAARRFVALIEMPADTFREARDAGRLGAALDDAIRESEYDDLAGPDGARERAQAALEHFSQASGAGQGKAMGLLIRAWWQAMKQAIEGLGLTQPTSSLIGSPPSTDGLVETSSTTSRTETPAS